MWTLGLLGFVISLPRKSTHAHTHQDHLSFHVLVLRLIRRRSRLDRYHRLFSNPQLILPTPTGNRRVDVQSQTTKRISKDFSPEADFEARGMTKGSFPGRYPYRDVGLKYWDAIHTWVIEYLDVSCGVLALRFVGKGSGRAEVLGLLRWGTVPAQHGSRPELRASRLSCCS